MSKRYVTIIEPFSPSGRDSFKFLEPHHHYKIPRRILRYYIQWSGQILHFTSKIALYLGNGTTEAQGYNGSNREIIATRSIHICVSDLERWDAISP